MERCYWCGHDATHGEHGKIGPSDQPGKVSVQCLVSIKAPQPMPRLDVIEGVGYFRREGTDPDGNIHFDRITPHADINPDGVLPIEDVTLADFKARFKQKGP